MISIGYFLDSFTTPAKQARSDLTCIARQKISNTCTMDFIR